MVSLTSIELLLQVLDMGVSSNDVIIISIFFLLKINNQTPKPELSHVFENWRLLLSHLNFLIYHQLQK